MSAERQREHSRFASVFAAGTLASRLFGLARDFSFILLPDTGRDAFLVAFKFPNMLRDLVGEGAVNAAFIPVLSEYQERDDQDYREAISASMSMVLLLLGVLTVLGVLIVPEMLLRLNVLSALTGTEDMGAETLERVASLSRWTFPYLLLIGMTVFCMAPLFTMKRYSTPSWSPALLNIAIILCVVYLRRYTREPVHAVVIGVWIGGVAQLAVNYAAMGRATGVWKPSFNLRHPALKTILVLMAPVVLGQAAGEVNKLVDTLFAAKLANGTVTALYYANRLVQLPLSIFGIATAVAILPSISRAGARGDHEEIRATLMDGFRQSFFLAFPALLGLVFLRRPLVRIFEFHHFDPALTERTATALMVYALGLLSFAWVKIAVTGFYAVKETKTPVLVASLSMVLNLTLNVLFVRPFGYVGLALATTLSFTTNFALLYVLLCDRYGRMWNPAFLWALGRMAFLAGLMIAAAVAVHMRLEYVMPDSTLLWRLGQAGLPVMVAALIYLGLSAAVGLPESHTFWSGILRRIGRST